MSKYKAILTTAGAAKIAAASAGGKPLKIDRMAVGDANGKLPTPNPAQTKLINERHRAALNSLTVDKAASDRLIAELVIPANVGGFWLREMGLYDADGTLIAVSNMAESYKPKLEEGSGRTQTLRMVVIVSHTEAITLIVSGDMVMATRDFVAAAIDDHAKSRNHPDATTAAKGFVQLSSVTNSTSEALAATPKAVKAVNDAGVKLAQNLADLPDKAKARANLGLKSAALCDTGEATGQVLIANKAFGLGLVQPNLRHRLADLAGANAFTGFTWTNSDDPDAPPFIGTAGIINHAWRASTTADPYTLQMGWRDGRMAFRTKESNKDFLGWCELLHTGNGYTAAQCDGKYALRSIKVNGKPLSADVNLLAGDVNAWNKTEADARYLKLSGGTVKNLTVKTGSTGTENTALLIDGVEHTPLVLKRSSATANLSIGFQLGGNAPLYRLGINDKNNLSWGTDANQASNATIYHTKNKPTAADVGALTDAQAVQKYALRSIKVNGKPLSGDVNLVAGDINAYTKTESNGRYVKQSGDNINWLTVKGAGTFQGLDYINKSGINTYSNAEGSHRQVNALRLKGEGNLVAELYHHELVGKYHNLGIHVGNGNDHGWYELRGNGELKVNGTWPTLHLGETVHHPDGNISGTAWGGYLSNFITNGLNGRVDWNAFNSRSHVAGTRQAWWYKDELTGFIFQGGVVNRGEGYLTWVGFPRGYTQDCFGVQLTLAGHWGDSNMNMEAQSLSAGGFNAALGDNERVVFWWAVGV